MPSAKAFLYIQILHPNFRIKTFAKDTELSFKTEQTSRNVRCMHTLIVLYNTETVLSNIEIYFSIRKFA